MLWFAVTTGGLAVNEELVQIGFERRWCWCGHVQFVLLV